MNYKALYRVYRPTTFADVKGQKFVVETLKNIITSGKISHAYLFNGPHGTGKTSVAKIFAAAINCKHRVDVNPCESCQLKNQNQLGIVELDAASNNGADDIRNLIENANTYALGGDYKIFIIDEAHMLSKSAFNAFLKTLEEPPKQTIFILATTEPHKIPNTILSRVQRFNFRRIDDQVIKDHLEFILQKEGVTYDQKVIDYLTNLANGSLRDGLSLADQSAVYSQGKISLQDLIDAFGITSYEEIINLLNFTIFDLTFAIKKLQELKVQGADPEQLLNNILSVSKDFILYAKTKDVKNVHHLNLEHLNKIKFTLKHAYQILAKAIQTLEFFNYAQQPFSRLEIMLIQIHDESGNLTALQYSKEATDIESSGAQKQALTRDIVTNADTNFLEKTIEGLNRESKQEEIDEDEFDVVAQAPQTTIKEGDYTYLQSPFEKANRETKDEEPLRKKVGSSTKLNSLFKNKSKSKITNAKEEAFKEPSKVPNDNLDLQNRLLDAQNIIDQTTEIISETNEHADLVDNLSNIVTGIEDTGPNIIETGEMNLEPTREELAKDLSDKVPSNIFQTSEFERTDSELKKETSENLAQMPLKTPLIKPKTKIQKKVPKLESGIIPQEDLHGKEEIINAFMQVYKKEQRHEEAAKIKQLAVYMDNDKYKPAVLALLPLKVVAVGEKFIVFSSTNNEHVYEALVYENSTITLELIEKIFHKPKRLYVITKKLFSEVKKEWKQIRRGELPQPPRIEIEVPSKNTDSQELMRDIFGDDLKEI